MSQNIYLIWEIIKQSIKASGLWFYFTVYILFLQKRNSYQLVIATDGRKTFVIVMYLMIHWGFFYDSSGYVVSTILWNMNMGFSNCLFKSSHRTFNVAMVLLHHGCWKGNILEALLFTCLQDQVWAMGRPAVSWKPDSYHRGLSADKCKQCWCFKVLFIVSFYLVVTVLVLVVESTLVPVTDAATVFVSMPLVTVALVEMYLAAWPPVATSGSVVATARGEWSLFLDQHHQVETF